MSPFTSNFTSDVTKNKGKKKKERCLVWMSTWCMQSSREYKHLRPLVLSFDYTALYHNGRKVIKCKETIIVKGSCNDDHQDLKVITWFIMILCNQTHGYFFVSKKKKENMCLAFSTLTFAHTCIFPIFPSIFNIYHRNLHIPPLYLLNQSRCLQLRPLSESILPNVHSDCTVPKEKQNRTPW